MKYPNGHEFNYQTLSPTQIKVDDRYQRRLETKRVDDITKEWNGDVFNEPKVSYRDNTYWVFNGQHSTAAWKKKMGENTPILCKVFRGMTWSDECIAFILQNGLDKDPTTNEKLRAAYENGQAEIVDIVNKAALCGYKVDFSNQKTPTRIVCTGALLRAYKTIGADAFLDMLTAIKEAWYGDMDAISTQIISGMTQFYKTYAGHFTRDDLVNSIKRITPAEIIRNGKAFTNRTNTYGREIVKQYNKKRRYRLDETKL